MTMTMFEAILEYVAGTEERAVTLAFLGRTKAAETLAADAEGAVEAMFAGAFS